MTAVDHRAEFETMRREAFRLQQRQDYSGAGDAGWTAWREGRPLPPSTPATFEFGRRMAAWTAAGRRIYDVRIIEWPLTDYMRYGLERIPMHGWTGYEVLIAERGAHPALSDLVEDFWMFDEERVAVMRYDEQGALLGAFSPSDPVSEYVARRDLALRHAVPFDEWIVTQRDRLDH